MRTPASIGAVVFLAALAPVLRAQAPPNALHFQARLSDAAGVALNGAVVVEVRLYDAPAGGVPLWIELHNATALNGVVTLTLGSITPLPLGLFDAPVRFLALRVGADAEMTPRRQLVMVPYAARSATTAALTPTTTIPSGLVTTTHILDGTIGSDDLANAAVSTFKIAVGAVLSAQIGDGAILNQDLGNGCVAANNLANGAVTTPAIASNAIIPLHILDGAVNSAKILDGSILGIDIAAGAIDGAKILNGSITASDLANNSVTSAAIADGTITSADVATGSLNASVLAANSVTASEIAAGAVGTSELADGAVSTSKLDDLAVTAPKINNNTITDLKISALAAIAGTKINPDFGNQVVTTSSNMGVGTVSPDARLHVVGSAFPNLLAERSTNFTNASTTTIQCLARTSASMTDGFGPVIVFSAIDSSAVMNEFAQISATRDGADNRGKLELRTDIGGTPTTAMEITSEGRVGVGLGGGTSSQYWMAVSGGSDGGLTAVSTGFNGVLGLTTSPGRVGVYGHSAAVTGAGTGVVGLCSSPAGVGVLCGGDFIASGTKSFVQPHPSDPSKELRFVCLEGVEAGTYFRASAVIREGVAVIEAPEAFRLATEAGSVTAVATPVGARAVVWIETESLDRIVVRGDADVKINVVVNGVRRGFAAHEPIRENRNFVPETRGVPFGTQYPDALRRVLVENGTLNPDFTPNEATATRLGWTLHEPEPVIAPRATRATQEGGAR